MASSLPPELLRLSSVSPSAYEYFTDSSNTLNIKSDLILVVGKEKFYCHRLLLSLVSPVFTRMFDGEFKEHNAHEIVLEGKTSESILELLKYIYPQFYGQITNNNIEDFLLLADEYMIEHLKQPCKDVLIKQLQAFKFVLLPTQQKLEQPSLKSKSFHASDSALDSSQNPDEEPVIPNNSPNRSYSSRRTLTSSRHPTKSSSTYFKSNDKNNSSLNNQPRYVLFLDKTSMPIFYDAHKNPVPFTTNDVELWLRRLRILYQIDKGRNYGEIIDYIVSILQFIPATLLYTLTHITMETYSIDELMLNDITRARMYILEEWASDGDPYRLVKLTDSYRTMSPSVLVTNNIQRLETNSINIPNNEEISIQDITITESEINETVPIFNHFNIDDSD